MAVKVLIRRHFREGKSAEGLVLLNELRTQAMNQPGHITGETLVDHYDDRTITTISTWQTIAEWIRWEESNLRAVCEAKLEKLLEDKTTFEIYDPGRSPGD